MSKVCIDDHGAILFYCPGCKEYHAINIPGHPQQWDWNKDVDKPTITPSIKVSRHNENKQWVAHCHLFVTDGKIQYLGDCLHELKGQTIEMEDDE